MTKLSGARLAQRALLLAGEAAWLSAGAAALGAWVGGSRAPLLEPLSLAALLAIAALAARLAVARGQPGRAARLGLAVAGLTLAVLAGLSELPAAWVGRWAEALEQLFVGSAGPRAVVALALALLAWWRGLALGSVRPTLFGVESAFRTWVLLLAGFLVGAALAGPALTPTAGRLVAPTLVALFAGLVGMPLARLLEVAEAPRHRDGPRPTPGGPWLTMLLAVVAALLLLTLLLAQLFTFQRLDALARLVLEPPLLVLRTVLGALLYVLALPIGFLLEQIVALLRRLWRPDRPPPEQPAGQMARRLQDMVQEGQLAPEVLTALRLAALLALAAVVVLLLARAVARRREGRDEEGVEEVRDFVWAWPGLGDVWRWLLGLLRRAGRPAAGAALPLAEWGPVGSVRELYRQFLALAAATGRPRQPSETPLEYGARLTGALPVPDGVGPPPGGREVDEITAGYVRARYAGPGPGEPAPGPVAAALARLRALWLGRPGAALIPSPSPGGRRE